MPLILAIEPDRRQASQLTALVRGRLHAELVISDSADRALAALGERVPDLVLTAALLSPRDEAALGQRLRELNGVAAHVQTLTIPVLASAGRNGEGRTGGLLSALRRDKPSSTTEGCDPAVFAEQCKEYLERAASERELASDHAAPIDHEVDQVASASQPAPDAEVASFIEDAPVAAADVPTKAPVYVPPAREPVVHESIAAESIGGDSLVREPVVREQIVRESIVAEAVAPAPAPAPPKRERRPLADPLTMDEGPASLVAALALFEEEEGASPEHPSHEHVVHEQPSHDRTSHAHVSAHQHASDEHVMFDRTPHVPPAPIEEPAPVDEMDLSSLLDASVAGTRPPAAPVQEVEVYDIDDALLQSGADQWFAPDAPAAAAATPDTTAEASAPAAAPAAQDESEHPQEWLDIIEALRRDAEQVPMRKAKAEPAPAPAAASATAPKQAAKPDAAAKKKRHGTGSPAQDEWGFFDPDQCGFAALLEKLQEVSSE